MLRKNKTYARGRGLSNVTAFHPTHETLDVAHPALSIIKYIDTFGPLVFPLLRLALLRQRVLFVTPPPVRQACEFGRSIFAVPLLSQGLILLQQYTTFPYYLPFLPRSPTSSLRALNHCRD